MGPASLAARVTVFRKEPVMPGTEPRLAVSLIQSASRTRGEKADATAAAVTVNTST